MKQTDGKLGLAMVIMCAAVLGGTRCALCTTLQWDFKASQNSATLTVEAPKTDTTASTSDENATVTQNEESTTATIPPPPTPEEMQQEAEQSGCLAVWHEFTWWYPWYKLHVDAQVNPQLSYSLDLFGFGDLDFIGLPNPSSIDMGIASQGALAEAGLITAVSAGITLSPEKMLAVLVGSVALFAGTCTIIALASAYNNENLTSFLWGMLNVLYVALYATLQYAYGRIAFLLERLVNLWFAFDELPIISTLITALVSAASIMILLIWPPPLRGILSISVILSIIAIWLLILSR